MYIHSFCGTAIFILNLLYGLGAIYMMSMTIMITIHGIVGSLLSITGTMSFFNGIVSRLLLSKLRWRSSLLLKVQYFHKVSYYFKMTSLDRGLLHNTPFSTSNHRRDTFIYGHKC